MAIVGSARFALSELEFFPENGKQLLFFGEAILVDATFLQHGHRDW